MKRTEMMRVVCVWLTLSCCFVVAPLVADNVDDAGPRHLRRLESNPEEANLSAGPQQFDDERYPDLSEDKLIGERRLSGILRSWGYGSTGSTADDEPEVEEEVEESKGDTSIVKRPYGNTESLQVNEDIKTNTSTNVEGVTKRSYGHRYRKNNRGKAQVYPSYFKGGKRQQRNPFASSYYRGNHGGKTIYTHYYRDPYGQRGYGCGYGRHGGHGYGNYKKHQGYGQREPYARPDPDRWNWLLHMYSKPPAQKKVPSPTPAPIVNSLTGVESPVASPASSPAGIPGGSPVGRPIGSSVISPVGRTVGSPVGSPAGSPVSTLISPNFSPNSPAASQVKFPVQSPAEMPIPTAGFPSELSPEMPPQNLPNFSPNAGSPVSTLVSPNFVPANMAPVGGESPEMAPQSSPNFTPSAGSPLSVLGSPFGTPTFDIGTPSLGSPAEMPISSLELSPAQPSAPVSSIAQLFPSAPISPVAQLFPSAPVSPVAQLRPSAPVAPVAHLLPRHQLHQLQVKYFHQAHRWHQLHQFLFGHLVFRDL